MCSYPLAAAHGFVFGWFPLTAPILAYKITTIPTKTSAIIPKFPIPHSKFQIRKASAFWWWGKL